MASIDDSLDNTYTEHIVLQAQGTIQSVYHDRQPGRVSFVLGLHDLLNALRITSLSTHTLSLVHLVVRQT